MQFCVSSGKAKPRVEGLTSNLLSPLFLALHAPRSERLSCPPGGGGGSPPPSLLRKIHAWTFAPVSFFFLTAALIGSACGHGGHRLFAVHAAAEQPSNDSVLARAFERLFCRRWAGVVFPGRSETARLEGGPVDFWADGILGHEAAGRSGMLAKGLSCAPTIDVQNMLDFAPGCAPTTWNSVLRVSSPREHRPFRPKRLFGRISAGVVCFPSNWGSAKSQGGVALASITTRRVRLQEPGPRRSWQGRKGLARPTGNGAWCGFTI